LLDPSSRVASARTATVMVWVAALPPWLATSGGRRFFAYVHFREPHQPYNPPPPFDTRFGPAAPLPAPLREDPLAQQDWIKEVNQGRRPLGAAERDHVVRLYDGNIALADDVIGSIRQALEKDGLWERTVVIVTGDHGEALFEHGWIGHNTQLYDESAHVPLVVRFPSAAGLAGPAGLIGGGPTFLGTLVGQRFTNDTVSIAFLSLAAGSILYVVMELLNVCRLFSSKTVTAWGLLLGLTLGFATNFVLVAAGV